IEDPLRYFSKNTVAHFMDVDHAIFVVREELVYDGDAEDARDTLVQHLGHRRRPRPARLQPQQRGDRLQVVLHAVVDLLDHRRLDLDLLLFAHFVGDVLDRDQRPGRLVGTPAPTAPPAPPRRRRQRHYPLDPDLVALLDAALQADVVL